MVSLLLSKDHEPYFPNGLDAGLTHVHEPYYENGTYENVSLKYNSLYIFVDVCAIERTNSCSFLFTTMFYWSRTQNLNKR